MEIERLREPCPKWAANEINRLRAELALTQGELRAARVLCEVRLQNHKADNATKDARIAELERHLENSGMYGNAGRYWEGRWRDDIARAERAEAELKAVREALKYLLSELPDQLDDMRSAVLARAALAPPPAGEKS